VAASWDIARLQTEICKGTAFAYLATVDLLKRHAPDALEEYNKIFMANKGYFLNLGITTPLELATALAEIEENMFGSKMSVAGDGSCASVTFEYVAEWAAVEAVGQLSDEDRAIAARHFFLAMSELGRELGFATAVAFNGPVVTVSYSKDGPSPSAVSEQPA